MKNFNYIFFSLQNAYKRWRLKDMFSKNENKKGYIILSNIEIFFFRSIKIDLKKDKVRSKYYYLSDLSKLKKDKLP